MATSADGTSAGGSSGVADSIRDNLKTQGGVLFAKQCIVHRVTYSGRDIIAPNSAFTDDKVDERGYVPVERWILSKTVSHTYPLQSLVVTLQTPHCLHQVACNPVNKAGEGISQLVSPVVTLFSPLSRSHTHALPSWLRLWAIHV